MVDQAQLPKSSVHYLLVTLERRGYLSRSPRNGKYLFGAKLFGLANSSLHRLVLPQQVAPLLSGLQLRTGLTVHMAIREQNWALLVAKIESRRNTPLSTCAGKQMDLHCTGVGKALLAHLPHSDVDNIIRERGLSRHNENTIVNPRRLHQHLEEVGRTGYALDDEEEELGLRCVGMPIFAPGHRVFASISVAGTVSEITLENIESCARELKITAGSIERCLSASTEALLC
jgi:DNA-binding IclR family transcriptional regulator